MAARVARGGRAAPGAGAELHPGHPCRRAGGDQAAGEGGGDDGLPPGHAWIASPYDPDARWGVKREESWLGYKLHVTGTCDLHVTGTCDDEPRYGCPGNGGAGQRGDQDQPGDADLGIPLGDAPVPARPGQPCPPGIGALRLTIAETARLIRLARQYAAGLSPASASPSTCTGPGAAPAPGPRPMAPLRLPPDRRSHHLTKDDRKEVTERNRKQVRHVTVRDTTHPQRETATVLPG